MDLGYTWNGGFVRMWGKGTAIYSNWKRGFCYELVSLNLSYISDRFRNTGHILKCSAIYLQGRIKLDVGGHVYTTSLLTLTRESDSMLAAMFSGRHELLKEEDGCVFIDRDGTHFRSVTKCKNKVFKIYKFLNALVQNFEVLECRCSEYKTS